MAKFELNKNLKQAPGELFSHHVLTLEEQTAKWERTGQQGKLTFITFLLSITAFNKYI